MPHPAALRIAAVAFLSFLLLAVGAEARPRHHRDSPSHSSHGSEQRVLLYDSQQPPPGWRLLEPAAGTERLNFTLILQAENLDELERRFWQRTDPDHELYTEWMSNADIEQLVRLRPEDEARLRAELAAHGITAAQVVSHGDSFDVSSSVASASSLFASSFHHYAHMTGRRTIRQHGSCSLPAAIAPLVVMTLHVHTFPAIRSRPSSRRQPVTPDSTSDVGSQRGLWVPQGVAGVYGLPMDIAPLSTPSVSAGVIEWGARQSFNATDLLIFSNVTALPLPVVSNIVGLTAVGPGDEASLDIQWMMAMDPGATAWFWQLDKPDQWLSAQHAALAFRSCCCSTG